MYLFIVKLCVIKYEKFVHNCYQIKKIKIQGFFKLWNKGKANKATRRMNTLKIVTHGCRDIF